MVREDADDDDDDDESVVKARRESGADKSWLAGVRERAT